MSCCQCVTNIFSVSAAKQEIIHHSWNPDWRSVLRSVQTNVANVALVSFCVVPHANVPYRYDNLATLVRSSC